MKDFEQYSLKAYNSFGIDIKCNRFLEISLNEEIPLALESLKGQVIVFGGGSNILFTKDFEGTVLHLNLIGKEIIEAADDIALVYAAAGEDWHSFVMWSLQNNLGGIENLSLIPGNCGAAPIQNIGAYGTELMDVFHSLDAFDTLTNDWVVLNSNECRFSYRDSIFKSSHKGRYIITGIRLKLTTNNHQINSSYGAIEQKLKEKNITLPGIKDISEAVIEIRSSKLPDPSKLGNCGSFFKNPVIPKNLFEAIKFDSVPHYPVSDSEIKVPAGWLIEKCGWKGKRVGDAGCHEKQALVLVNYGNATGNDILELAEAIRESVYREFGIMLTPEVNVL